MKDNLYISPSHKEKQLAIIQEKNPAPNDYLTWIRGESDILSFKEAQAEFGNEEEFFDITPDLTGEMVKTALEKNKITVYSSYPIKQGTFVTPSKMEAQSYSGRENVYSKTVSLDKIAWIDEIQGQFADVDAWEKEKSSSLNDKISAAEAEVKENKFSKHTNVDYDR